MVPVSRRSVLRSGLVSCSVVFGGCARLLGIEGIPSGSEPKSPTPATATGSFETPAPGECEAADPPRPTPTEGFQPVEYPTYPDSLSARSAEGFAREYEEAYQYNAYLAEEAGPDTRSIDVQASADSDLTEEAGDGFLVGVDGERSTSEGDGTVVVRDDPIAGVYHLAPEFALRGEHRKATFYEVESFTSVEPDSVRAIFCRNAGGGG